ncbi:hypothetical protein OH77DRAFT_643841 [Trametes cingulata]|nr:hypothetical protein OH77DRAFT_643841 [Trametes cingulata]
MRPSAVLSYFYVFVTTSFVSATVIGLRTAMCPDGHEAIASETSFIGETRNVKLVHARCYEGIPVRHKRFAASKRQNVTSGPPVDVYDAECDTVCGANGLGPDPDDCKIIANALLYETQAAGPSFVIGAKGTSTDQIRLQYGTCSTFFFNKVASTNLTYCREDWSPTMQSSLVNWFSDDCITHKQTSTGRCAAKDQRWFVQVRHAQVYTLSLAALFAVSDI